MRGTRQLLYHDCSVCGINCICDTIKDKCVDIADMLLQVSPLLKLCRAALRDGGGDGRGRREQSGKPSWFV